MKVNSQLYASPVCTSSRKKFTAGNLTQAVQTVTRRYAELSRLINMCTSLKLTILFPSSSLFSSTHWSPQQKKKNSHELHHRHQISIVYVVMDKFLPSPI
jgi:hypothetical protein